MEMKIEQGKEEAQSSVFSFCLLKLMQLEKHKDRTF